MSGDVFGNGMLLSRQIKLVAAFDHRHIFIDPTPDPEVSYHERKRLFETPRSTWADYRPESLSIGGDIFPRQAKSVPLSPEIRVLLGADVESISGEELVRTILKLPVDLLYNGGIGTHLKVSHETHADASDEKNDAVRVNASELSCRVVGEGGNLGFTHAARVEFAARGGRINTDFIDNSGGVDLSDHEVNIKLALAPLVRDGTMAFKARNKLLEELAPAVCQLVLETNRNQARALSLEERASATDPSDHLALLKDLRRDGLIEKTPTGFPDTEDVPRRREAGVGLLRPELATLPGLRKNPDLCGAQCVGDRFDAVVRELLARVLPRRRSQALRRRHSEPSTAFGNRRDGRNERGRPTVRRNALSPLSDATTVAT